MLDTIRTYIQSHKLRLSTKKKIVFLLFLHSIQRTFCFQLNIYQTSTEKYYTIDFGAGLCL